jgi:hypothetical protein
MPEALAEASAAFAGTPAAFAGISADFAGISADFSWHPARDAGDSEALFCITEPFAGDSAEPLLQQNTVALHQKSSA